MVNNPLSQDEGVSHLSTSAIKLHLPINLPAALPFICSDLLVTGSHTGNNAAVTKAAMCRLGTTISSDIRGQCRFVLTIEKMETEFS